jgi:SPP1 family predicted phage head-tail adaptor
LINAGDLNVPGRLERDAVASQSGAVVSKTPEIYARLWAEVKPISGREAVQAQQLGSEVAWRVRIRWRNDVEPSHRFIYGAVRVRRLEIVAVMPNESDGDEILLYCRSLN